MSLVQAIGWYLPICNQLWHTIFSHGSYILNLSSSGLSQICPSKYEINNLFFGIVTSTSNSTIDSAGIPKHTYISVPVSQSVKLSDTIYTAKHFTAHLIIIIHPFFPHLNLNYIMIRKCWRSLYSIQIWKCWLPINVRKEQTFSQKLVNWILTTLYIIEWSGIYRCTYPHMWQYFVWSPSDPPLPILFLLISSQIQFIFIKYLSNPSVRGEQNEYIT